MKPTAWRAALRIARRDALRAKGRSALVLAMIALPVLGVAGADVVYRSAQLDPDERIVRLMGTADAEVSVYERGQAFLQAPNPDDGTRPAASGEKHHVKTAEEKESAATEPGVLLKRILPAGTVLTLLSDGPEATATTSHGLTLVETTEKDLTSPVWHGMVTLLRGHAPAEPQEIAATQRFLDDSGLHLGDTTTVRGITRPFTITAAVEYPDSLDKTELIGRPGALIAPLRTAAQSAHRPWSGEDGDDRWLVQLPGSAGFSWHDVRQANRYGFVVTSRQVLLHPPDRSQVPYYTSHDSSDDGLQLDTTAVTIVATVAGMALLEIVLLAGPAFAVGARRSRRQLGLLAAGGGDRSHVRGVVLAGGVVLGTAGAVVGVVLGIIAVTVGRSWLEGHAGQRFGHLDLYPLDLLAVAAIGLVTGILAALVPAIQASRLDVVAALTGRGTVKPPSKRLAAIGALAVAGGACLAVLGGAARQGTAAVLGGSMLAELGMVALTPLLVGLFGKLGRWLPLGPRLALRDSVRHRGRTAPAVAAVMAAVAGSVAIGLYTTSVEVDERRDYQPSAPMGALTLSGFFFSGDAATALPAARAAVEHALPGLGERGDVYRVFYRGDCRAGAANCGDVQLAMPPERECPLEAPRLHDVTDAEVKRLRRDDPRCQEDRFRSYYGDFEPISVGDAAVLHTLFQTHDRAAEQALAAGRAVVFDGRYLKDGHITLRLTEPMPENAQPGPDGSLPEPPSHLVTVPAVAAPSKAVSQVLLPASVARKAGLQTAPAGSVWLPPQAPSGADEQRATAAANRVSADSLVRVERGYQSRRSLVSLALTGFAALVALGAAGIATGLAAADSQQDLATLAAVGAAPRIRRTLSGFQCGVIAAMGAVLGAVCGVVPAVALRKVEAVSQAAFSPKPVSIVFPWSQMALTVVALPLLAVVLAALLTRSRITLRRRAD